jgi:hypothetical protein
MPRAVEELEELQRVCEGAKEMQEGGVTYLFLPSLKVPNAASALDALLCAQQHGNYTTRLFLSAPIAGRGANWSTHTILSRTWHTWSWNNVPTSQRLTEILAQHLRALR